MKLCLFPNLRWLCPFIAVIALLCSLLSPGRADKAADARRAVMSGVKRIIVVPPFFGTELQRTRENAPTAAAQKNDPASLALYRANLQKLEARTKSRLPERVAARTPYEVIPFEQLQSALEDLLLTPALLFQNNGKLKGNRFAEPDPVAIRKLCAALQADAIVLGTLDEPRTKKGGYIFDPCGIFYESAHVRSRAGYFVMMADGSEGVRFLHEVLHPVTRIGKREYLVADWLESQDQLMEALLDEWTRYTPHRVEPASEKAGSRQ